MEIKIGQIVSVVDGGGLTLGDYESSEELVGIVVVMETEFEKEPFPIVGVNWVAGGPRYRGPHPGYDCAIKKETIKEVLGEIENDT